jgi:two-component system phosphate regulon response regulator PhoB
VDVYIRRLREKVEVDADHPAFLKTVRGAGYLFESESTSEKQE